MSSSLADTEPRVFWEPVTFQVGDRVRVRLSGECRIAYVADAAGVKCGLTTGHFQEFDGAIGRIEKRGYGAPPGCGPVIDFVESQGHRFTVSFSPWIEAGGRKWGADSFAAAELELLERSS